MKSNSKLLNIVLNIIFILFLLCCILPVILVVIVSFTDQSVIDTLGYTFFPSKWSIDAYKYVFTQSTSVLSAYKMTIVSTVVGTFISVAAIALYAYPLSRADFKFKKFFTFYVFFTMLFGGGLVAWYVVVTKYLHLKNTFLALVLPNAMNAWYVIIMRTFFQTSIPPALIEASKIDGAGEFRIFLKIVLPLAVPAVATIALFQTLVYWNDWWNPMLLVNKQELYTLQLLLQIMLQNIQKLSEGSAELRESTNIPTDTVRMALCVVAMGPILIVYPFFQKYFIQGLTIGSVKG
ncbi:MAG: carbohydrate ABC transporter permease [Monoglobaceae bacterium]